jgi:hypothetical protein
MKHVRDPAIIKQITFSGFPISVSISHQPLDNKPLLGRKDKAALSSRTNCTPSDADRLALRAYMAALGVA